MSGQPGKAQPTYTPAFRADAVRLIEDSGTSLRQMAADLGLATESLRALSRVAQARIEAGQEPDGALAAEWEELRRLRREVTTLRMEREILRKAAAFFARETS